MRSGPKIRHVIPPGGYQAPRATTVRFGPKYPEDWIPAIPNYTAPRNLDGPMGDIPFQRLPEPHDATGFHVRRQQATRYHFVKETGTVVIVLYDNSPDPQENIRFCKDFKGLIRSVVVLMSQWNFQQPDTRNWLHRNQFERDVTKETARDSLLAFSRQFPKKT
jgi:hypothetical protein